MSASKYKALSKTLKGLSIAMQPLSLLPGAHIPLAMTGSALRKTAELMEAAGDFKHMDISNARQKVQKAIDRGGKPVIIFIDDADRLPPPEIRMLFQFLKAVAAFNNVSYVLAYDSKPVERALTFDDNLDGREYLKKFIQLPIRLPRLSRTLMRRFITRLVESLRENALLKGFDEEIGELVQSAQKDVVLNCLKTPRDAVRCFNALMLRIPDCLGEVHLVDLFQFVLLDLISPESVEFVQTYPEVFLTSASDHPEFNLTGKKLTSFLPGLERDLKEERSELYSKFTAENRGAIRALVETLFPGIAILETNDVLKAANSQGLIKLLYGGGSSFGISVREARSFLLGRRRKEIVLEKSIAGSFKEWLCFLSAVTTNSDLVEPAEIALLLSEQAETVDSFKVTEFDSVIRMLANYFVQIVPKLTGTAERRQFLDSIVENRKHLYIAHLFLLNLAVDAGLWDDGVAFSLKEIRKVAPGQIVVAPEEVIRLERKWLDQIRALAKSGELHTQPGLAYMLYFWVQLQDEGLSEVHDYIATFCEQRDALQLLKHFPVSNQLSGWEDLIGPKDVILESLGRHESEPGRREATAKAIKRLLEKEGPQKDSVGADPV